MTKANFKTSDRDRSRKVPDLIAWHVPDREAPWTRIGAAWSHSDGEGLSLQLDLMPVAGGRIVLRDLKAEAER
jgi:hypothetical protein